MLPKSKAREAKWIMHVLDCTPSANILEKGCTTQRIIHDKSLRTKWMSADWRWPHTESTRKWRKMTMLWKQVVMGLSMRLGNAYLQPAWTTPNSWEIILWSLFPEELSGSRRFGRVEPLRTNEKLSYDCNFLWSSAVRGYGTTFLKGEVVVCSVEHDTAMFGWKDDLENEGWSWRESVRRKRMKVIDNLWLQWQTRWRWVNTWVQHVTLLCHTSIVWTTASYTSIIWTAAFYASIIRTAFHRECIDFT